MAEKRVVEREADTTNQTGSRRKYVKPTMQENPPLKAAQTSIYYYRVGPF